MYDYLMIRYGELGLKGKNKNQFINALVRNIEHVLEPIRPRKVENNWGRLMIPVERDLNEVIDCLQRVFGIYSMSPVKKIDKDIEVIKAEALAVLQATMPRGGKFKVESRRADKTYPIPSPELSKVVAGYIFDNTPDGFYEADMYKPEFILNVEVRLEGAYIFCDVIAGAKGLPVGTSGKAVLMLSGGIDSPVAGYMAMKRGVTIEAIHYHSYPFTSDRAKEKVFDLCRALSRYSNAPIKVHVVHFTEVQKEIYASCPAEYGITVMRRFMYRIAEEIAKKEKAKAIYNGECVGQVASQTLDSMLAINEVCTMPVLRPLVGFDKEEIMALARKINTYEISIRPYEDCCTLFLPKHPKIRPDVLAVREMEKALDIEGLIKEAIDKTETMYFSV